MISRLVKKHTFFLFRARNKTIDPENTTTTAHHTHQPNPPLPPSLQPELPTAVARASRLRSEWLSRGRHGKRCTPGRASTIAHPLLVPYLKTTALHSTQPAAAVAPWYVLSHIPGISRVRDVPGTVSVSCVSTCGDKTVSFFSTVRTRYLVLGTTSSLNIRNFVSHINVQKVLIFRYGVDRKSPW